VTTHLYDGVKSLPLDVELYQHASSLAGGKANQSFIKKPELALKLVDKKPELGLGPGVVLVDAGYGNNSTFLKQLESKKLKYVAGLAKNRKVIYHLEINEKKVETRLDELAKRLQAQAFTAIQLDARSPKNSVGGNGRSRNVSIFRN
jgi:SRSO17 transposase